MTGPQAPARASSVASVCGRCGRTLEGTAYEVRSPAGRLLRCLRCALLYGPLVLRSCLICLLIGTLLTAINQGNLIVQGEFPVALAWKIPLTYAVPYGVATAGAILNARSAVSNQRSAVRDD